MSTSLPPTGQFPAEPSQLEREELDAVYLELRKSYRGLMVSRGQFRGRAERNHAAMQQLETRLRNYALVPAALSKMPQTSGKDGARQGRSEDKLDPGSCAHILNRRASLALVNEEHHK